MIFENIVVGRLIVHEVFRRRDDKQEIPPRYGSQLIQLSMSASDAFNQRVTDALGNNSQCTEMDIHDVSSGSAVECAASLIGIGNIEFIAQSKFFADKLTRSQLSRNLPGGILVVFTGTFGSANLPFVGVIKAETQSGFRREVVQGNIGLTYLDDLFLTPAAKLYKIGVFIKKEPSSNPLPDGWTAFVYDSQRTLANRDGAAQYFYEAFLGCQEPKNSAYLTKTFFENTRDFIKRLSVSSEERADLLTSLYTYLKVDQTPQIQVHTFASTYLPPNTHADYRAHMQRHRFPLNAVTKDVTEIKGALRQRKLVFASNIKLTATPEAFRDLISIEVVPQRDAPGQHSEWTVITIKDRILEQT